MKKTKIMRFEDLGPGNLNLISRRVTSIIFYVIASFFILMGVAVEDGWGFFVIIALVFVGLGLLVHFSGRTSALKDKKGATAVMKAYQPQSYRITSELGSPYTLRFDAQELFLTPSYLISRFLQLRIMPIDDVVGARAGNNDIIILSATHGEFSAGKFSVQEIPSALDKINQHIAYYKANPNTKDITPVVSSNTIANAALQAAVPTVTYSGAAVTAGLSIDDTPRFDEAGMLIKPNRVLGLLGAMIGAALGILCWVLVYQLGYLSGLAGVAIAMGALYGYKIAAKGIDRFGAVASIVITVVSVLAACYISTIVAIMREADCSFGYAITLFNHYIDKAAFWGEVAVGYFFAALCTVMIFVNLLRKAKKPDPRIPNQFPLQ